MFLKGCGYLKDWHFTIPMPNPRTSASVQHLISLHITVSKKTLHPFNQRHSIVEFNPIFIRYYPINETTRFCSRELRFPTPSVSVAIRRSLGQEETYVRMSN